jgi:hypothetical protein
MDAIVLRRVAILVAVQWGTATLGTGAATAVDKPAAPTKPNAEGRPVYLLPGRVVVLPENVELAPKGYVGVLNVRPFALIKLDGDVAGEIYFAPLKKSPAEEARGMAASPDKNPGMKLTNRSTMKDGDKVAESVTLKFERPSALGNPWVLHSLYFPSAEGSTTFKLAAAESNLDLFVPYLHEMVHINPPGADRK